MANTYAHIAATTTKQVLSANPGALGVVVINQKGASTNQLAFYDGPTTTQNTIAIIDTVNAPIGAIPYNLATTQGLTMSCLTGTAGDFTIIYG